MGVTIFAMTHKKFPTPKDPIYIPLQVGKKCAADLGYMGDDTGDNISEKNCYYAELSGMYWVWKNFATSNYVGICHYRRYFCTEEGRILSEREYEELLADCDMIVSKKLKLNHTYYDGYAANHYVKDLQATGEVIKQYYPEYYDTFEKRVHEKRTYFGNMMVCEKSLYDAYCEWLFGIFDKLEKKIDPSGYDNYHKRVFGFISEFLLMVWVEVNKIRTHECKVGMTGEKRETFEMKEKLAEYFRNKDVCGAKTYFMQCINKRPDVLMEASDITGELKLSMQVIATCELELKEYGHCLLDYLQDFDKLMDFVKNLNEYVSILENKAPLGKSGPDREELERATRFLEQNEVSEIAVSTAKMVVEASLQDIGSN